MTNKVTVSEGALVKRINNRLAKGNEALKKTRPTQSKNELGDWYIVDTSTNHIVAQHCELEELGRETEALKPYEYLAE